MTAGGAAGAAFLAACGGGESDGGGNGNVNSLVARPEDTTKEARRGGAMRLANDTEPPHFDPHALVAAISGYTQMMYSRLLQISPGYLKEADGSVESDAAESYEYSPDRTQITFKLRPNVAFQDIPPVSGRNLDAEDVAFSFKRMSEVGINRSAIVNAINPNGVLVSVTATDSRTVVVKLKEPVVFALDLLSEQRGLGLIPKEAAADYDPRRTPIGSGAFRLSKFEPSVALQFTRHDKHYDQPRPFVDTIELPLVTEYAAGLAQFRAGNMYWYENLRAEDVLSTKRDIPQLQMYATDVATNGQRTLFGQQPSKDGKKSPFLDERVRQAYSMSMDRGLWIQVIYNTDNLTAEGLPVETRWNTALTGDTYAGWWLDPKSKDFGPNARYFEHNLAEAKKLMAAAGYAEGVELESHIVSSGFGPDFASWIEVLEGFAKEAGFNLKPNLVDYNTVYVPQYRDSQGKYSGVAYKSGPGAPATDAVAKLEFDYHSKAGNSWYGYDVKGAGDLSGDPYVDQTIEKAKAEFDDGKRRELVRELQRYLGKTQYAIRHPGGASNFDLAWPVIRNFNVFRGIQTVRLHGTTWWLDSSQPPLNGRSS